MIDNNFELLNSDSHSKIKYIGKKELLNINTHFKITYLEKIELLRSESSYIYYEKIEKLFKKLAYFKSTTINNSIYNLESKNKNFLTELNIYIKCFIDELQTPLATIQNGLNLLLINYINPDEPQEKNINITCPTDTFAAIQLIIDLDKTIKYINNSFTISNIS